LFSNLIKFLINYLKLITIKYIFIGDWGLGIGDWGLGVWANTPTPKPQTPNPKPQKLDKKIK
jgi:hypothetical protein